METTPSENRSEAGDPEWLTKAAELKQVTLQTLAAMSKSERDTVPPLASWSASGIVEHLILVEECVAGSWRERLRAVPKPKTGFKSALVSGAVSFIFSKTGLRVPTVPELEPVGGIGIDILEIRWDAARKRLVDALPKDNQAAWILHPALGPLSSLQMGGIMSAHLEHHLRRWPKSLAD